MRKLGTHFSKAWRIKPCIKLYKYNVTNNVSLISISNDTSTLVVSVIKLTLKLERRKQLLELGMASLERV